MSTARWSRVVLGATLVVAAASTSHAQGTAPRGVRVPTPITTRAVEQVPPAALDSAIIGETGSKTPEISTAEMRSVLANRSAVVLDARPYSEFAIGHIPGAVVVGEKPGMAKSMYVSDVAEVGRLLSDRRDTPIVLYCNGPFCGKSKRLADELLDAGYTNVRRYQLGIPMWRALGGVTQIEDQGLRRVFSLDQSAVLIDTRDSLQWVAKTLPRARNIPRSRVVATKDLGEIRHAKDDGRLPMEDHGTRIIVFGNDSTAARFVAEQITKEAFYNVSFYAGSILQALLALGR